ncbi:HAD-hyrolase-like [Sinosporangium album]|uniref:HAD-hyrolase-like n=1 Tax=Sinosporangium album TaxID=504805 RepID=A0A1G8AGS8_9ACTN|nr:HAD hydrolase-like protein [Sinosporangium album]SDH20101.1 HAD-hyrolase-like [Sinosporangium album]
MVPPPPSRDACTAKPDPEFFKVAEVVPFVPEKTLYVRDRLDNDVRSVAAAGMRTALIRRGP